MAQRIDVSVAVTVELHTKEVGGKAQATRTNVVVVAARHVVDGGIGIVRPGDLVHRQ
jgi:hypothetical protein